VSVAKIYLNTGSEVLRLNVYNESLF